MKKILCLGLAVAMFSVFASAEEKKEEKKAEKKESVEKMVLCNFEKSTTQFLNGEFVAEHLTAGEKMRCKLVGDGGIGSVSPKKMDWSPYNYLVFNVFVEGKDPWTGMFLIGDMDSYKSWATNYVEMSVTMKPGENKDFHVGIQGLFCAYKNRPLDMKNMKIFKFFGGKPTLYIGNMYLVSEEE
jgi:hypothetical protein